MTRSDDEMGTGLGRVRQLTAGVDRFSLPLAYRVLSTDAEGRLIVEDALRMKVDHGLMYHCSALNAALADDDTFDMAMKKARL